MNRLLRHCARLFTFAALLLALTAAQAAPKKLLMVTVTKGFRHSSIGTAEKVLGDLATKTGVFTVDYARNDDELKAKTTLEALKSYDGVIFANTTGDLPLADREGFLAWIKSGKAFVGMHSATDTFPGFPSYIDMIGGQFNYHKEQVKIEARVQSPNDPSVKHFGKSYVVFDEIYVMKNFYRDRVHGLLGLDAHPNDGTPGDYPVAWSKEYGKGKMFYTSLGHREDVWESAPYQEHIMGGIKWALGLVKADATPQDTSYKVEKAEAKDGFKALFNGKDLSGWKLRNANGTPSWSAQNGMLVNTIKKGEHGTDLVSEEKFRDFTVRYEYLVPKNSNSGFYLRGRHELQILGDFEKKEAQMGGNGGLYSIRPPDQFVSRPYGEWQEVEATLKGNRLTVILNGVKIHDNVEVNKATGGELDANLDQPGPFMLQGDHGAVAFRNIRVKPLK